MVPFEVQAGGSCPHVGEFMLALAAEFHSVDVVAASDHLDALGEAVRPIAACGALVQAGACLEVLHNREGFRAREDTDPEALMLDRLLARGEGHPLALAALYVEVARRGGLELLPLSSGSMVMVGHPGADPPVFVDPVRGTLLPRDAVPRGAGWRCPHGLGFLVLGELIDAFLLRGDVVRAIHGARLRLSLPLADDLRERMDHALRGLQARFN
jgi:hypothetical protein